MAPLFLKYEPNVQDKNALEIKGHSETIKEDFEGSSSKPLSDQSRKYGGSKETIVSKYAAMREQNKQPMNVMPAEDKTSAKVSLLEAGSSQPGRSPLVQTVLASRWASMKAGFQTFKANMEAKKFLPLRQQVQETQPFHHRESSSESLDQIFQRLKRPSTDHEQLSDQDEYE